MKKTITSLLAVTIIISAFATVTTKSFAQYKSYSVTKLGGGYDFYGSDYSLKGYSVPKMNGGYDFYGSDYSLKGYVSPRLGW